MKKQIMLVLLCVICLCSCGGSSKETVWQEQYDLGVRYLSEGNYEEAIIAFTAAIEIDPKQALAYIGRGDAYVGSNETEETLMLALADYEKAMELDDTLPKSYLGLAEVYIQQGDYEAADTILRNGLNCIGENSVLEDKLSELRLFQEKQSMNNVETNQISTEEGVSDQILTDNIIQLSELPAKDIHVNFHGLSFHDPGETGTIRLIEGENYFPNQFNSGIRDITIGDSFGDVLNKLGISEVGAQYIAQYMTTSITYRKSLSGIMPNWGLSGSDHARVCSHKQGCDIMKEWNYEKSSMSK